MGFSGYVISFSALNYQDATSIKMMLARDAIAISGGLRTVPQLRYMSSQ
jgi:hypothetical protein